MAQYKTVAGPIALKAQSGEDYGIIVKKYAAIIDDEAVGGWELHLIQQIAVEKSLRHTLYIGIALGAILGVVFVNIFIGGWHGPSTENIIGGFLGGAAIGAVFGCFGIKNVTELFNMLVFVKYD